MYAADTNPMNANTLARYEARAKIIKALAHPARLMIVDELASHKERCVCELTEVVGTDMSTVSRHLSQLKAAGIVEDDRRGKMTYFRLKVKCLTSFFGCVESVLKSNAESHQQLVKIDT